MNSNKKIPEIELEIVNTKNQVGAVIINLSNRGDRLEELQEQSTKLIEVGNIFNKTAKKVKYRFCCQKWQNGLIIGIPILCIIILIIVLLYYEMK